MRYLSVCAGIEAASVAWHDLKWEAAAYSEIEPFPSAVLDHHYPSVPKVGDMTKYKEWDIGTINLLVGGTPCQSFSVAGLRKGLEDPRGNLALVYCGILDHFKPKWFVWENVPGVLSSAGGRDFGSFLGAVAQLGYGFAYRVLDAQYFGVAQRRRRVFVVGCLGDWRSAAEVLFERYSLSGDSAPSREKRQITPTLTKECTGVSRTGHNEDGWYVPTVANCIQTTCNDYSRADGFNMIKTYGIYGNWIGRKPENGGNAVEPMHDVSPCLTKTDRHGVAHPITFGAQMSVPQTDVDLCQTLQAKNPTAVAQPMAFAQNTRDEVRYINGDGSLVGALAAEPGMKQTSYIQQHMAVRRLTPVECERLQGFPDNYTNIPWRKKDESPDGPRYKALGNSMAVPVMKWIGQRIKQVESA
jgi:DNA (cytosine-5)-methyltransferase 1